MSEIANWNICGGYKLYTTLDLSLQKFAQNEVWNVPKSSPIMNIGAAYDSVEVGTGRDPHHDTKQDIQ